MVNGPRPSNITAPTRSPKPAVSPARSPLMLQRQHTSIYSTASAETPVLVYGKTATPLAGAWSAEPWAVDAARSGPEAARPTVLSHVLEVPHEGSDQMDAEPQPAVFDDASSVAETAVYTDSGAKSARSVRTKHQAPPSAPHVAFKYRFDPYSACQPRHEVYRCECPECLDGATLGSDRLVSGAYHSGAEQFAGRGMEAFPSDEFTATYDGSASAATHSALPHRFATAVMYDDGPAVSWHPRETHGAAPTDQPPSLTFMPPPPPPKITRGVVAESAEGDLDVDAAFYHIAMRWYNKLLAVQDHFVSHDDHCPEPSTDQPFDEWVVSAGKWWLRHFEHQQMKTSISSGMLRSAPVPAHARTAVADHVAPTGFETHASVSASYSNHRTALRTGPRKVRGSSGLTAQMLESLPAPRSFQRAQELPW